MSEPTSFPDKFSKKGAEKNSKPTKAKEKSFGLYNFLKLLEEMDNQGITQKSGSGKIDGPFSSKAEYNYNITIDTTSSDFHTLKTHTKLLTKNPVKRHRKKRI